MSGIAFAPIIISVIIFFVCLGCAVEKKKGLSFFALSFLVLLLLCAGSFALLANSSSSVIGINGWGLLIFLWFYVQSLPGLASLIGFFIVSANGPSSNLGNPYEV